MLKNNIKKYVLIIFFICVVFICQKCYAAKIQYNMFSLDLSAKVYNNTPNYTDGTKIKIDNAKGCIAEIKYHVNDMENSTLFSNKEYVFINTNSTVTIEMLNQYWKTNLKNQKKVSEQELGNIDKNGVVIDGVYFFKASEAELAEDNTLYFKLYNKPENEYSWKIGPQRVSSMYHYTGENDEVKGTSDAFMFLTNNGSIPISDCYNEIIKLNNSKEYMEGNPDSFEVKILNDNQIGTGFNKHLLGTSTVDTKVEGVIIRITSTILTILQMAAVAGIVICGVRYMLTSAEQKADIKKSMIYLVIGCVIVFATSTVVQFIIAAFGQATAV